MIEDVKEEKQSLQSIIHALSIKTGEYTDPENEIPGIEEAAGLPQMPLPNEVLVTSENNNDLILDTEEDIEIGTVIPIDHIDLSRVFPEKLFGNHSSTPNPVLPIFQK
jgi:hypothetical protein